MKKIANIKISPSMALDGLKLLSDAVRENNKIQHEESTKRVNIKAMKEYELEKIYAQKEILLTYFENIFTERETNFRQLFEALDRGIEDNNLDLIQNSIGAIVKIAEDSPLKQIENIKMDFYNPEIKEIEI